MNDEHTPSPIQQRVHGAIQSGALKVRPRWVFGFQVAGTVLSAIVALAAAILALSFVFYSVFESGEAFLLGFGWSGVLLFLMLFPWVFLAVALALIALFQWSLSYVVPSYRVPLIPLFVAFVVGLVGVGYVFVPLHTVVSDQIDAQRVPFLDELYESVYESREGYGIFRGVIVSVEERGFRFVRSDSDADEDDEPRLVVLGEHTDSVAEGYEVFIFGRQEDGVIYASHLVAFPDAEE